MDFEPMRFFVAGTVFFAAITVSFSQKRCDCALMDTYVRERYFQEVNTYQPENLEETSKKFLESGQPGCKAFGIHLRAVNAIRNADYLLVKYLLDREKKMLDSLKCKPARRLENEISYGDYYLRVGNAASAITHYQKAWQLVIRQDNKTLQAHILLSLSNAESKQNQESRARTLLMQAHPVVHLLPNTHHKVEELYNLSARYYYQFQVTNDAALLDSAQHAAAFGLELARKIAYNEGFIRGYNLMEDKQFHEKQYRRALMYLDSALFFTQPVMHASERMGIYSDMADIYLRLKKYDKAYECADSGLVNARLTLNPYKVKNALELLYNCAKLDGEYERALVVYEDLALMRDSVNRIENQKLFSELEEKYHRVQNEKSQAEYEQDKKLLRKQKEIGKLKSKLITVGIVISALLASYIFIIFRQKNMRSRQKRLEIEQRLQRARINPDFIYKALGNLQRSASGQATQEELARKLTAFTKLIKQTLESSHDDFLTLDKEVDFLTLYMDLQRDRHPGQFTYRFEIDEQIDQSDVCLPAMILQPFIEQTIERGFRNLKDPGLINLSFQLRNNELHIRIQDNGSGLKAANSERATEIINDRLYLLNKMNKTNASYLIRERSSGGVSVEIFLPLITRAMADSRKKED